MTRRQTDEQRLAQKIRTAFANVPYPGDWCLRGSSEGDEPCKAACVGDNKCRAWTYARAGYVGRAAHCFLKKDIKPPRRKAGFISGVVR